MWCLIRMFADCLLSKFDCEKYHPVIVILISKSLRLIHTTVVPTKSDSDVIFCLQLLSETLTYTLHSI